MASFSRSRRDTSSCQLARKAASCSESCSLSSATCSPRASKALCCSAILARSTASASSCRALAAALSRSESASSDVVATKYSCRESCSRRSLDSSVVEASWVSTASLTATIHRCWMAPFCSSRLRTSAACLSWVPSSSTTASEALASLPRRRSRVAARSASSAALSRSISSLSCCRSSSSLATKACTTGDGSQATSRLISALFFTSLARLPNSNEHLVSSRSASWPEHVMMRQVLELPPKLSARSRVSMESL
mmetsp:Transcript_49797/g.119890  ORF Transcript_49797/g.119890 Transcript_49797/m.119890 type:complete len:252 (+) Transcript_49797:178-933(+)